MTKKQRLYATTGTYIMRGGGQGRIAVADHCSHDIKSSLANAGLLHLCQNCKENMT